MRCAQAGSKQGCKTGMALERKPAPARAMPGHLVGQFPDRWRCAGLRNPVLNIALMVGITDIPDWCYVETMGTEVRLRTGGEGSGVSQGEGKPLAAGWHQGGARRELRVGRSLGAARGLGKAATARGRSGVGQRRKRPPADARRRRRAADATAPTPPPRTSRTLRRPPP
jgi:hypothetical protein